MDKWECIVEFTIKLTMNLLNGSAILRAGCPSSNPNTYVHVYNTHETGNCRVPEGLVEMVINITLISHNISQR